jgi:hypothetical protein
MEEKDIKKEYDELVNKCKEIVDLLKDNPNNDPKMMDIILNPKTIKEYKLAMANITFFSISSKLINEEKIELDKENNFFYNVYIDLIKAMKNNQQDIIQYIRERLTEFSKSVRNPAITASITFDLYVFARYLGKEEFYDEMALECGYDLSNEDDLKTFTNELEESRKIIEESSHKEKIDLSNIEDSKEIDEFIDSVDELKRIYNHRFEKDNKVKIKIY